MKNNLKIKKVFALLGLITSSITTVGYANETTSIAEEQEITSFQTTEFPVRIGIEETSSLVVVCMQMEQDQMSLIGYAPIIIDDRNHERPDIRKFVHLDGTMENLFMTYPDVITYPYTFVQTVQDTIIGQELLQVESEFLNSLATENQKTYTKK